MCSYETKRQDNLTRHMKTKHRNMPKNEFYCEICGNKFTSQQALKLHLIIHQAGKNTFKCRIGWENTFQQNSRISNLKSPRFLKILQPSKDSVKIKHSIQHKLLILTKNGFTVNTALQNVHIVQEYFEIVQKERGLLHVILEDTLENLKSANINVKMQRMGKIQIVFLALTRKRN